MKVNIKLNNETGEVQSYFLFENERFPKEIKGFEEFAKKEKFKGKEGSAFGYNDGKRKVIVLGLGKRKEFELDSLRKASASAYGYANAKKAKSLSIRLPKLKDLKGALTAVGEAIVLSSAEFDKFKTKTKESEEEKLTVKEVFVNESKKTQFEDALNEGIIKADAQNFAAELSETPANVATPLEILKKAKELAKKNKLSIKVMDKNELRKKGMNLILAVNQGSAQAPVMIILEHNKGKKLPLYTIVGKGVTFDSGGLDLKPGSGMLEMKYDKTGACNVLGVLKAVSELKLPIRVMGVMPLTENMPGSNAIKPGDIIKAYNGKMVEIINTDAEGRLILGDALAYASEFKPKAIIDMATLTGAAIVCFGKHAIAMLGNDDKLMGVIERAGIYTHERVWKLPLWKEYSEMIKSELADIKNLGSDRGEGGTITAAAFLKEFVGKSNWVHLDIATMDNFKDHPYLGSGATGAGTRLVIETLKRLSGKK